MVGLFPLGQLVWTGGAQDTFEASGENPGPYLDRHVTGDWSEMDEHDQEENRFSVDKALRVFSAHTLKSGEKIWIVTGATRESTTILLPSEY